MTHEDILNQLLTNATGTLPEEAVRQNDGFQQFIVLVQHGRYKVEAKLTNDRAPFKYEVKSMNRM
jgi:hypothetical protein